MVTMAMFTLCKVTLLVIVTMNMSLAVPTSSSNGSCTAQFQTKFQELLEIKETCKETTLKDCCQIANVVQMFGEASTTNRVYTINDVCAKPKDLRNFRKVIQPVPTIQARCDTKDGWLVIFRRKADVFPLVNFTRKWVEYENGFGTLETEFWYGLRNIHCLTEREEVEMMIELKQNDGTGITWIYKTFRVDGPETNYVLHIGDAERLEGTGNDAMAYHNNHPFSTIDRDNDPWSHNCAADEDEGNGGGWWYYRCYQAALTRPHTGSKKIAWYDGGIRNKYFPHVEMKIRPKTCLVSNKEQENCD